MFETLPYLNKYFSDLGAGAVRPPVKSTNLHYFSLNRYMVFNVKVASKL